MKKAGVLLGLFVAVGFAPVAQAGNKTYINVVVSTAGGYAYGSIGTVRNSGDTTQTLYCSFYGSGSSAYCFARDSAGTGASCSTTDSTLIQSLRGLNSDSYLRFHFDGSGNCTQFYIVTGSMYEPKSP